MDGINAALLAQEGIANLQLLQFTVVQDSLSLARTPPSTPLNEVITLIYILSGLKFSSAPAIIGTVLSPSSATPSTDPHTAVSKISLASDPSHLPIFGSTREPALQLLSQRIWDGLAQIAAKVPVDGSVPSSCACGADEEFPLPPLSYGNATVAIAVIRLAAKITSAPTNATDRAKLREVVKWGTEMAANVIVQEEMRVAEGEMEGLRVEEKNLLRYSAAQLAIREGFESLSLGTASSLSPGTFTISASLSTLPALPVITPDLLAPFFLPPSPQSRALSASMIWGTLVPPAQDYTYHLMGATTRPVPIPPATFYTIIDEVLEYYDQIITVLLTDERRGGNEEGVWRVLRTMFTGENCTVEMGFLAWRFYQKRGEAVPEEVGVRLLEKIVRRLKIVLDAEQPLTEVYHVLELLATNVDLVGSDFSNFVARFDLEDQKWLSKALKFAGFWDGRAGEKGRELDALFEKMSLAEADLNAHEVLDAFPRLTPVGSEDGKEDEPPAGTSFLWSINEDVPANPSSSSGLAIDAELYDVDLFDSTAETIAGYKSQGKKVVCYYSAGSYEGDRSDDASFSSDCYCNQADSCKMDGWDEWWLDIHSAACIANVKSVMQARLQMAADKGCDGVEPDNVDSDTNDNGQGNTAADQLSYNLWTAETAHSLGLAVALKNAGDQLTANTAEIVAAYDFAIVEQCEQYDECDVYQPFVDAGKAAFDIEYQSEKDAAPVDKTGWFSLEYSDEELTYKNLVAVSPAY
ncbi:hypothetical protein MNV49_007552 [Pseudohyphozyma bogoriensis]|nr:hypothetical protein MNV49_007552 [Pseudohyphozyma bogoriensis]